jgi:hypothetical protein
MHAILLNVEKIMKALCLKRRRKKDIIFVGKVWPQFSACLAAFVDFKVV